MSRKVADVADTDHCVTKQSIIRDTWIHDIMMPYANKKKKNTIFKTRINIQ
jgi:hypothetical protein